MLIHTFSPQVKTLHTVLSVLETAVDFFKRYQNVDRILELAMITVPEKMAGRGVGRRLVQVMGADVSAVVQVHT